MILARPGATLEAEHERKNDAINVVTAYCNIEEGDMCGGRKRWVGRPKRVVVKKEESPSPEDKTLKSALLSVFVKHLKERPTVCFMCLGNKAALADVRIYSFSSPSDLSKAFQEEVFEEGRGRRGSRIQAL